MNEMKEAPVAAPMEKIVGAESFFDAYAREIKGKEDRSYNETSKGGIVDDIRNELPSQQIERLLDRDLHNPEVQRKLINEFSPYSDKVNPFIRTLDELSVYKGLKESSVQGEPCLQMEIDRDQVDAMGTTNAERMAEGRSPLDEKGDVIELHHIGQKVNSPLAELPSRIHRGQCDAILHDKTRPSEVHGEGNNWDEQRALYWKERAASL